MKIRAPFVLLCCTFALFTTLFPNLARAAMPNAAPPGAINVVPNPRVQGEGFGAAMAIDGDTLVVGAPLADVGENDQQGAVYIFQRVGDNEWQQVKRITASDGRATDWFGAAVAVHGDTIAVGAIYADPGGKTNQGVVYIFTRNEGGQANWGQVKKLVGGDDDALDNYGSALALHGDNLFVASPNHDLNGVTVFTGLVYHYQRNAGEPDAWGEVQQLSDPDPHTGDAYGSSLAFDGATLVIGAARADLPDDPNDEIPPEPNNNVGAAFVYTTTVVSGTWEQADVLYPNDGYANIETGNFRFGASVALHEGLIAVGAPNTRAANGDVAVGNVYLFTVESGWSEQAKIGASNPEPADNFGQSLVAAPEGVLVYASKGNGVLYAYQLATGAGVGDQPTQASEQWQEVASFEAGPEFFNSGYGSVLVEDNGQIAIGAPQLEGGTGGVFLHEPEELFVAPAPPEATGAYLPLLAYQPPQLPTTGQLVSGGKVMGPNGSGIAAPAGSLDIPVNVSLQEVSAPQIAHEMPIQLASAYYRLGAENFASAPITQPFILALPIAAGVDPAHLALAALVPAETVNDADNFDDAAWLYFEGEFDAANQRFLATWPVLPEEGVIVAVVQHPNFDAVSNAHMASASPTSPRAVQFSVTCLGFYEEGLCTPETELQVAAYLSEIHERMTAVGGFNYIEPRLRNLAGELNFDNGSLASLGYAAYIERHTARICSDSNGYYQYWTGRLVLCLAPNAVLDEENLSTLIHEYFHATQYAYPAVYQDATHNKAENWLIEGMAAASTESYFLDQNLRRQDRWAIHTVDVPIDQDSDNFEQYSAQDFWVYVGKQLPGNGANLGYLKFILQYGADKSAVDDGLTQHFNTSFGDQLWDWASNQVLEKEEDLDGVLGAACVLEDDALRFDIQHVWNLVPAPQLSFWPSGGGNATVQPYTTMVVQMVFPHDSDGEAVSFIYPQCEGIDDFGAWVQCYRDAQEKLPAQMYAEGLAGCFDDSQGRVIDPELGVTIFGNIERSRRYFVVVTNVTESVQGFRLAAELGGE